MSSIFFSDSGLQRNRNSASKMTPPSIDNPLLSNRARYRSPRLLDENSPPEVPAAVATAPGLRNRKKPSMLPPRGGCLSIGYTSSNNRETPKNSTFGNGIRKSQSYGDMTPLRISASSSSNNDSNTWIIAYGFSNSAQAEELYRKLSHCGKVIARRNGSTNYMLLQFQTRIAEERSIVLSDGTYCGIDSVSPDDPVLEQSSEQMSSLSIWKDGGKSDYSSISDGKSNNGNSNAISTINSGSSLRGLQQKAGALSIFKDDKNSAETTNIDDHDPAAYRSICDRFMRIFLALED